MYVKNLRKLRQSNIATKYTGILLIQPTARTQFKVITFIYICAYTAITLKYTQGLHYNGNAIVILKVKNHVFI